MYKYGVFFIALLSLLSCTSKEQKICLELSRKTLESLSLDKTNIEIEVFYSKKFDGCFQTEQSIIGIGTSIRDINKVIIKDTPYSSLPFHCDESGIDAVNLASAERYGGKLFNIGYKDYLDDMSGGAPRALKFSKKSKAECVHAMTRYKNLL